MSQSTVLFGGLQVKPNYNSAQGSPSMLTMSEVTVPAASVKILLAKQFILVPAPGPGLMLVFISASLLLDFVAPAYAGASDIAVRYAFNPGTVASEPVTSAGGFISSTADAMAIVRQKPDFTAVRTSVENKALVLHNVGAVEFSAGNSPLRVKISYQVVETGW